MKVKQMVSARVAEVVRYLALVNLLVILQCVGAIGLEAKKPIRIVAFGDSLTAGYMLPPNESFPAQLGKALADKGRSVVVENAGVSGDTTGAGLERLDWSIPDGTDAVIVELGANDALRGLPPSVARTNLEKIVARLSSRGIDVLIAGMLAPKNWGPDYEREFNAIFGDLARKYGTLLYPFFLDGVALDAGLTMDDGLHPTGKGVAVVVARILPKVEELLARVEARRQTANSP